MLAAPPVALRVHSCAASLGSVTTTERIPTSAEADERIDAVRALFDSYQTMSIATSDDGAPWAAKVFFVDDMPSPGRLDLCIALIVTSRKLAILQRNPRLAFVVAGDMPDRWVQGTGEVSTITDDAESSSIGKALAAKSPAAGPFLGLVPWKAMRVHVGRLKYTDITMSPPVAEFVFEQR
jgi:nitroimidazol reductase NimA-like FMN-containing flavoprotein (pyridoxamine 5'-phosphate oxidase superfamily)